MKICPSSSSSATSCRSVGWLNPIVIWLVVSGKCWLCLIQRALQLFLYECCHISYRDNEMHFKNIFHQSPYCSILSPLPLNCKKDHWFKEKRRHHLFLTKPANYKRKLTTTLHCSHMWGRLEIISCVGLCLIKSSFYFSPCFTAHSHKFTSILWLSAPLLPFLNVVQMARDASYALICICQSLMSA